MHKTSAWPLAGAYGALVVYATCSLLPEENETVVARALEAVPGLTLETSTSPRLPYAIPIFIGTVVTLWLR